MAIGALEIELTRVCSFEWDNGVEAGSDSRQIRLDGRRQQDFRKSPPQLLSKAELAALATHWQSKSFPEQLIWGGGVVFEDRWGEQPRSEGLLLQPRSKGLLMKVICGVQPLHE